MTEPIKTCTQCGESLPLSSFYANRNGRYGVASRCKSCHNQIKRRRYRGENPQIKKQIKPETIEFVNPPPGLLAKVAWSARQSGAPPDAYRNSFCPHYGRCLTAATEPNLDFSCRGCEHEFDQISYRSCDHGELAGIIALLAVVFGPDHRADMVVRDVFDHLGEYVSIIAGERPRPIDQPHWGKPG